MIKHGGISERFEILYKFMNMVDKYNKERKYMKNNYQNLTIYDFSKILQDLDALCVSNITMKPFGNLENQVSQVHFNWSWHGYCGFGYIFLYEGKLDISRVECRDSNLTISTNSDRQAAKHYSTIYNEPNLEYVFLHILDKYLKGGN